MRQIPNGKRSRNRPGRMNRPQNSRVQSFDSSGPEGKVRGTANQVYEKYLALARDASSSGDRVMAENFFQHAEHYFRIMLANGHQTNAHHANGFGDDALGDDDDEATGQRSGTNQSQPFQPNPNQGADRAPQPQGQPQPQRPQQPQTQPQPQSQPQPSAEQRPKTPAELAQAVAANADGRGRGRRPGRPPGRRGADDAAADA